MAALLVLFEVFMVEHSWPQIDSYGQILALDRPLVHVF